MAVVEHEATHQPRSKADNFDLAYCLDTAIWVYDIDHCRIVYANQAACRLWQAANECELRQRDLGQGMSSTVAKRLRQYQQDFIDKQAHFRENWTLYPNNEPVTVTVRFRGFRMSGGRMCMLCEAVAVAEAVPENLRSAEALLHTDVMITLYPAEGPTLYCNPAARNSMQDAQISLRDRLVEPGDYRRLVEKLKTSREFRFVARIVTVKGTRWHDLSAKSCLDAATGVPAILVTEVDVTELKDARDQARYLAEIDPLTGCYNRAFLNSWMERQAECNSRRHSLMFVDLDRFKQINDNFGHAAGDALLQSASERMRNVIRQGDFIARVGGDEFILVLSGAVCDAVLEEIASRVLEELIEPINHDGQALNVSASIGISRLEDDSSSWDEAMRRADVALYASKQAGRNRLRFYDPSFDRIAREQSSLEADLRLAVERDEIDLHYQPRVSLAGRRVVSVESLARWCHPERGSVSPGVFIPICEEIGLIERLGINLLHRAHRQARVWRELGLDLSVAVNLSSEQFNTPDLLDHLQSIAATDDFEAGMLELEITESTLLQHRDEVKARLDRIVEMGFTLAIDDFGTGYSNLAYVSRVPMRVIKIDKCFIDDLPNSSAIVELILALAEKIGATTVAEGVENHAQLDWLKANSCDQIQGFLFSKPLEANRLPEKVREIAHSFA